MVYIDGITTERKHVRIHAPAYESADDAVADFVARRGPYSGDWLRLDVPGRARYIRYEEVVDVRPADGASHIDS